jgi:hypothetical protein
VLGKDVGDDVPINVRIVMDENIAKGDCFLQACSELAGDGLQLREAFETFPHSAWRRQLRLADDVRCNIHACLHGPFQVQSNNILEIIVRSDIEQVQNEKILYTLP